MPPIKCCNKCIGICNCLDVISSDNSVDITKGINDETGKCQIDLQVTETDFNASSSSLIITPGGIHGHSPNIELVPSTDQGNILLLGSDGHPYVQGILVQGSQCISINQSIVAGKKVYTAVLDFQCIANAVCGLCAPSVTCNPPLNLIVT